MTEMIVDDNTCNYNGKSLFDLSRFTKLQRIQIGSNSFTTVSTLNLTGLNELRSITIGDNSLSGVWVLDLTSKNELVSISIGDNCFTYLNELHIEGLSKLESVTIGMNSFTLYKNSYRNDWRYPGYYSNGQFYLRNCPLLKEVRIGRYSFSDYAYSYVENLESLELLEYGDVSENSYNFYWAKYVSFESDR